MTARTADIASLPYWPRLLSREQAAAYVGLSPNKFIEEVEAGTFPAGVRLAVTRRALWDRHAIDAALDRLSPILREEDDGGYQARKAAWERRHKRSQV